MYAVTKAVLIAVLCVGIGSAAVARVQSAYGGSDVSNPATAVFGSSVSSGNWIVVFARNGIAGDTTPSISDTLGTSYTLAASNNAQNPAMWAWYGKAPSSGANTVTVTFAGASYDWVFAIEVSGAASSTPLDVASATTQASGSDVTSAAITTTVAGEYVVLATTPNAYATYTAGTDFTLVNGAFPVTPGNYGGVEEYIPAGTLSSYTAHITSTSTAASTVIVVSLKPAGGASTPKPHRGVIF